MHGNINHAHAEGESPIIVAVGHHGHETLVEHERAIRVDRQTDDTPVAGGLSGRIHPLSICKCNILVLG